MSSFAPGQRASVDPTRTEPAYQLVRLHGSTYEKLDRLRVRGRSFDSVVAGLYDIALSVVERPNEVKLLLGSLKESRGPEARKPRFVGSADPRAAGLATLTWKDDRPPRPGGLVWHPLESRGGTKSREELRARLGSVERR